MASPSQLFQSWPVVVGCVVGVLAYAVAATLSPRTSTAERLDAMQAEIEDLRERLEEVDARAHDAGRMADDLQFDLKHSPGAVIGGR